MSSISSSRWSSHPTQLSSVPGRVEVLYSQSGVVGVAGQPQIYCFFTRGQVWGEEECSLRVGEDVRINARLVPSSHRHEMVPYLATTVWREGCELPSALALRLLSHHTPDELQHYHRTVPGLVGLLPDSDEDHRDGMVMDRLGSALVMQGIIAKHGVREKEGATKAADKSYKAKRDRHPGTESQIKVEPEKKKKRLKSSSDDEPIKHLDCLHKINDIIAELEKKVATEPPKSSNPSKPDPPAQPEAISYPQPGIAYSLTPPLNKPTSPHHIGFPNPNKVTTAPAWLGLTVAPGSVSTAINPISNPLVPAREQQACTGDISEEEDQSPINKSLFTDIFDHERSRSPGCDSDESQPRVASNAAGKSDTKGGLGAKLSNLLQDRIHNRTRGKETEKKGKTIQVDKSREKTTSQSRSRSREKKDLKKNRRTSSRSSSQCKDKGKRFRRWSRKRSRSRSRKTSIDRSCSRYTKKRSSPVKKRHSRSPSQIRKKIHGKNRIKRRNESDESRSGSNKIKHERRKQSCSPKRERKSSSKRSVDKKSKYKSRSRSTEQEKRKQSGSKQREGSRRKKENDNKSRKNEKNQNRSKRKRSRSKNRKSRRQHSRSISKTKEGLGRDKDARTVEKSSEDKNDDLRNYIEKLKVKQIDNSEHRKHDKNLNNAVSDYETDASEDEKIIRKRRLNRSKFLAAFKDDKESIKEINCNKIELAADKAEAENVPIAFFEQSAESEEENIKKSPVVYFDAEVLHDGSNSSVLQLGAFATMLGKQMTFFKYLQPNLLKGDKLELLTTDSKFELMDCLRLKTSKFDVTQTGSLNFYFKHPELGSIPAEKERDVLVSFIGFLKSLKSAHPVILVSHRKDTVLPALFSLFTKHNLLAQFSPLVAHCCELVHLAWELHMDHLWQGARYPGLRGVAEFVDKELKWDDGYLPCDKISSLLGLLVDQIRKDHKLSDAGRFVEQCGGVGVMDYMTAKYNLVQSASGSKAGVERPDHVEVVRGSDQWGRKIRIDLKWKENKTYTKSRSSRRTPVPEPDVDDGEEHVRILKPEESKPFKIKSSEISWSDKTFNTFLPPGVSKISPLSTTRLLLRVPALKPRISELLGLPVLVQQNLEFTHCRIIKSTQVLKQPENSMFPIVETIFENTSKDEVRLDSKIINFAVANIKLDSQYEA
eukprot:GFUD01032637.1.p1 GENE.GFUD01032637.1~~GFUD01032637.1.p1  ORF type:complete len:1163 (+),score=341.11 GFUD01032637.1:74-3562(+)